MSAPPSRAVPDESCCVASSVIAVVSINPGINTISEATITVCNEIGATKCANAVANVVATSALTASFAAARFGRVALRIAIHPINTPSTNATPRSSHEVPSNPATAAEPTPKARTERSCVAGVSGRSSARIASHADSSDRRPSITSSAIRSSAASARRFTWPGSSRSTRVCCEPCTTSASPKESRSPVGVDQSSALTCSDRAVARTAPSSRCDETPAMCSRRASSVRKRIRASSASSPGRCSGGVSSPGRPVVVRSLTGAPAHAPG